MVAQIAKPFAVERMRSVVREILERAWEETLAEEAKLADGAATSAKIADGAVGAAELADASVTTAKLAPGVAVTSLNGASGAVSLAAGSNVSISESDGTITISSAGGTGGGGGDITAVVAGEGLSGGGTVGDVALRLAPEGVTEAELADGAVVVFCGVGGVVVGGEYELVHRLAGEVEADLVVGADGLRSVVSRKLGLVRRPPRLRKLSLTAHVAAPPGGMEHGEMHVIPDGCIGYAPSGDGRCNLTLVVSTDQAPRLRDEGPEAFFRGKLREAPGLPTDLGATGLGELLGSGPFDWPTRAPTAPGAALVGDAAGYYDPFTGQGMYQAMAGARLLARAVAPALTPRGSTRTSRVSHAGPLGDAGPVGRSGHTGHAVDAAVDAALDRYARQKQGLTRPARRLQHLVEAVLSRPQLADFALGRLSRARLAMDRLVEVTGDLRTPAALLSPRVLSSLILPPTQEAP